MVLVSQMPQTCPQNPERYFGPGPVPVGWRPRIGRLRGLGRHGHTTWRCVKYFNVGQLHVSGRRTCDRIRRAQQPCWGRQVSGPLA